jgi:CRISPR system Cascade subunit CasC
MAHFLQFHLLTSYPPSNLNRDDLGRPKTATVGGRQRLRVSSQSLKRAWRTSDMFREAIGTKNIGTRTQKVGLEVRDILMQGGVSEAIANASAKSIAEVFGKVEADKLVTKQLAHVSPEEWNAVRALCDSIIQNKALPTADELKLLKKENSAVDIALFGRMLASNPEFGIEASAQVAHAITVHEAVVEDDYFTAIDDLSKNEDAGAGHLGETEFGAGVYYLYVCVNTTLLVHNLQDRGLAERAVCALLQSMAKVAPTGKQNTFASRAYASYIMIESGSQQPRSLHTAFLKPVKPTNQEGVDEVAIKTLEETRKNMNTVYGACADADITLNAKTATGTFDALQEFIRTSIPQE